MDLASVAMVKIQKMLLTMLDAFSSIAHSNTPFNKFLEGHLGFDWNLYLMPPKLVLMGIFARLMSRMHF